MDNTEIFRKSITLSAEKSITFDSGTGIFFGQKAKSINKISLNNIYLDGKIDLRNVELMGTMNTKLQTSIFNSLDEEMLSSKTSKATSDQYGPVYGPVYGDVLGTINSKGVLIGGDRGGYVGSTYTEVYESTLDKEFNPASIINLTSYETLESIPMNITKIDENLKNFKVSSYNTKSSSINTPDYVDSYFGNLYNLTLDGLDDNSDSLSNILYADQLISRIRLSSSTDLNYVGNIDILEFNKIYNFKDITVNNVMLTQAQYINGNVSIGTTNIDNSNANLLLTSIDINKPNISGNFKFNYSHPSISKSFEINGNISKLNTNALNKIVWDKFSNIEVQVANIDFPKSIIVNAISYSKFSNIENGNIITYNNQSMKNTKDTYDSYGVYGNLIVNVHERMAIYSNILGAITEITINDKDTVVPELSSKNLYAKLDYNANFNLQGNIFYSGNPNIAGYINTQPNNDQDNDFKSILGNIDTWVRYVKPGDYLNYVRWPSGYGFTNDYTQSYYDGWTNSDIRRKSWFIEGHQNIDSADRWYFQSGISDSTNNDTIDYDNFIGNIGLNNNEATFLFLGPYNNNDSKVFNSESTLNFHYEGAINDWYEYQYDNLTVCYYDYISNDDYNTKLELCKNIRPKTLGSHSPYRTADTLVNINYLSDPSIMEQDNILNVFKYKDYKIPKLANGMKRYIVFTYMKSWFRSYAPDVFRLSNFSIKPQKTTYRYIDLSWNLKSKDTLKTIISDFYNDKYSDNNVYLATGDNTITIPTNTSTYLLIGPISSGDFDKKYLYTAYLEFEYGSVNNNYSYYSDSTFELYKLESTTTITDKKTILSNINSVLLKSYYTPYGGSLYSSSKDIKIYNNLYDNKFKYFYFKFTNNNYASGMSIVNIKFKQYPQDDLSIPSNNIKIDNKTSIMTATIAPDFMDSFNLNYKYGAQGLVLDNQNLLNISGKIVEDPLLSFNAILANVGNVLYGNIFINGNGTFNQTELTGRFIDGTLTRGNLVVDTQLNYYDKNYYNYTWHSNLKYISTEKLDTIAQSKPFDGLLYKNIMLCGQMSIYNQDKTFTSTPLHDNQIGILEYTFKPDSTTKKNFTINFKYQIFSEFRGDYFYFQYSVDNGQTYYNLLRQSGDINDLQSVALLDKFRWKNVSFYLPYNPVYIFRWVFKKDETLSSGYDTVFLGDIFINYLNAVVEKTNDQVSIYADNFIGNISTKPSSTTNLKNFALPFLKYTTPVNKPPYGYVNDDIIINGNMKNYINPDINISSNLIYANINTYYRDTTDYMNDQFSTYEILSNTDLNVNKSWRLYNYSTLKSKISWMNWDPLQYDATSTFKNDSELALLSCQSKMVDMNNLNYLNNGLGPNDASIFTIGPLNYSELIDNKHQLEFKYYKHSNEDSDLGVIVYDYLSVDITKDNKVRELLTKIVDLYNVNNHYSLNDLLYKYDPDGILIKNNIISYPNDQTGFTPVMSYKYGWRDISVDLNQIQSGYKRFVVFFFVKDTFVNTYNNYYDDIVLIHDIKFTFKKDMSSFKFTGFTANTTTPIISASTSTGYEYLNIDTPLGKRCIQLFIPPGPTGSTAPGSSGISGSSPLTGL